MLLLRCCVLLCPAAVLVSWPCRRFGFQSRGSAAQYGDLALTVPCFDQTGHGVGWAGKRRERSASMAGGTKEADPPLAAGGEKIA